MSFVFFDTETTGLSRAFDQIVHFAAIKTDNDLNEIEKFEARSRLNSHVIPHPEALCVSRRRISDLLDSRLPTHYAMACAIRAKLRSWSPAIYAGYNSLRFDEELLRQAFFQTLHPPYLTSLHQNGRADVMGLALSAAAMTNGAIRVPVDQHGRMIFRLANLARENNIPHLPHDPLSDIRASLGLARLVRGRAPDAWDRFVRFSKKATVIDFIDNEDGFLLTEFFSNQAYHTPVVCVGADPTQATVRFCLALNSRTRDLLQQSDDVFSDRLRQIPCPVRRIRVNAAPVMTPLYEVDGQDLALDLDHSQIETLAQEIKSNAAICARIVALFAATSAPFLPPNYVEESIYQGFPCYEDESLMEEFHQTQWEDRLGLVMRLQDNRMRALGLRLIYLEAPTLLPSNLAISVQQDLHQRVRSGGDEPRGLHHALSKIDEMLSSAAGDDVQTLTEYRAYLAQRLAAP